MWNQTEAHIRQMLEELNIPFTEDVGEAAFYGPKVDINAKMYTERRYNDHDPVGCSSC